MDNELVLIVGQLYIENYRLKNVMVQLQNALKEKEGKLVGQEMAISQLHEEIARKNESTPED